MFERFSDRARKVMALANRESVRLNHPYIGTEHLLLGLIKEGSGTCAAVLRQLNVNLPSLASEVEKSLKSGPFMAETGRLPTAPLAKKVIECAIEEARLTNQAYVGTEHLLLGLLSVPDGIAAKVLAGQGLSLTQVRQTTLEVAASGDRGAAAESSSASLTLGLQEVHSAWPTLSPATRNAILAIIRDSRGQVDGRTNDTPSDT